jgi:hypothetical protein
MTGYLRSDYFRLRQKIHEMKNKTKPGDIVSIDHPGLQVKDTTPSMIAAGLTRSGFFVRIGYGRYQRILPEKIQVIL